MKSLFLLRHAKSAWGEPNLDDFDRPLTERGIKAAKRMGRALADEGLVPDAVLCSEAVRARATWDLIAPRLGVDVPVKHMKSLYLAAPSRLRAVIRQQPCAVASLMIIGHNPGLKRLAVDLADGGSDPDAVAELAAKFPTAALAHLRLEIESWAELTSGGGRLVRFLRPRDLA